MPISFIFGLGLAGVFVFALSGALAANRSNMDIFGHVVLAMLPAIGGGTVRDLILGVPVFWIDAPIYIGLAIAAAGLVYAFPPRLGRRLTWLEWADAVGLALFCVMGASKAFAMTHDITISVTMGVVTASVGGMLRDVVNNEVPLILQKEIYATAALVGGLIYCLCAGQGLSEPVSLLIGGVSAFIVRGCALIFGWSLPARKPRE
ncbi:MAG: trimeric intracellular cation channel family protein [Alphaproteobacteria bacterium]